MRTNIDIDDKLITEALKYAGVKTKKELIAITLREFIDNHKRKDISDLRGKVKFDEEYNYKAMRKSSK